MNAYEERQERRRERLEARAERLQREGRALVDSGMTRLRAIPFGQPILIVQLVFPGKPSEAVRTILKGYGFRWSPYEGAWQRQLNNAGRQAAQWALAKIGEAAT